MASSERRKGNRLERHTVKRAEHHEIGGERTWGSNGRAKGPGYPEEVDVILHTTPETWVQCKNVESVPDYIYLYDPDIVSRLIESGSGEEFYLTGLELFLKCLAADEPLPAITEAYERKRIAQDLKPRHDLGIGVQCVKRNRAPAMVIIHPSFF